VTRGAEEVLRVVPGSLREASYALGAPEWRTVLRVIVPSARAGLISSILLGLARAVGETAPVLFTAGGSPRLNWDPFSGPQSDLPLQIFQLRNQSGTYAIPEQWATAVVLIVLVLVLFTMARVAGNGSPLRRWRLRRAGASARRAAALLADPKEQ
jgi:phosphate transport system permease protein